LRSISTIRKADNLPEALAIALRTAFPSPKNSARRVLEEMLPEQHTATANGSAAGSAKDGEGEAQIPEVWAYLGVLIQVRWRPECKRLTRRY